MSPALARKSAPRVSNEVFVSGDTAVRLASLIAPVFLPAAELYAVAIPLADPTATVVANTVSCKACLKSSNEAF